MSGGLFEFALKTPTAGATACRHLKAKLSLHSKRRFEAEQPSPAHDHVRPGRSNARNLRPCGREGYQVCTARATCANFESGWLKQPKAEACPSLHDLGG